MHAAATAGLGFLLAVLWFDLMFDVQVRRHHEAQLPAAVLDSISAYYRRVTTNARPMNRLVGAAMLFALGAQAGELVRHDANTWVASVSLALTVAAVGLAGARTVRNAVRLGGRTDTADQQSALARAILRDHLVCITAIALVLILQLTVAS